MPCSPQPLAIRADEVAPRRFLDDLKEGASPLAIFAGEFEVLLKSVFEPELLVSTNFFESNTVTAWGAVTVDPDIYQLEIYRGLTPDFNWCYCPYYCKKKNNIVLAEIRLDGDGFSFYDEILRQMFVYCLHDPQCFRKLLDHIQCHVDHKLSETQCGMEWVLQQQGVSSDFDGYGDVESHLHVLKSKRPLFLKRYESIEL